jgi:hypothetical protein
MREKIVNSKSKIKEERVVTYKFVALATRPKSALRMVGAAVGLNALLPIGQRWGKELAHRLEEGQRQLTPHRERAIAPRWWQLIQVEL